jgi:hypothetical protein
VPLDCKIYDGECKATCESLSEDKDVCDDRVDDCLWLERDENNYGICKEVVLLERYFIYLFI